jgi:Zn-dependent protease
MGWWPIGWATTAYRQGRVTLNPLRHIDPFGTVVPPALLLLANTHFLFGYAKPVPVAFNRLRHRAGIPCWWRPRGGHEPPAGADLGPAGLCRGMASRGCCHLGGGNPVQIDVSEFDAGGVQHDSLPPLDGGRVFVSLLPRGLARPVAQVELWDSCSAGTADPALMLGPSLGVDLNYLSRWLSGITLWLLNGIVSLTGIEPTLNLFLGAA